MESFSSVVANRLDDALCLLVIVALWFVIEKCGAPGWNAFIPIRNLWCLAKGATTNDNIARRVIWSQALALISWIFVLFVFLFGFVSSIPYDATIPNSVVFMMFISLAFATPISIWAFVVEYQVYSRLARSFGKPTSWGIGLLFLPFVFMPLLAWLPDSVYQGPVSD